MTKNYPTPYGTMMFHMGDELEIMSEPFPGYTRLAKGKGWAVDINSDAANNCKATSIFTGTKDKEPLEQLEEQIKKPMTKEEYKKSVQPK